MPIAAIVDHVVAHQSHLKPDRIAIVRTPDVEDVEGRANNARTVASKSPEMHRDRVGPGHPSDRLVTFLRTQQFQTFSRWRVPHPRPVERYR